jgi:hypothetical protein
MSSDSSKVSFAKVNGAGASAAVTPTDAKATLVPDETSTPAAPAAAGSQAPAVINNRPRFSLGLDEDDDTPEQGAAGKVRRPYLNLVQPSSGAELKKIAPEGDFVLGKSIKIPSGTRAVVVGFGSTFYREKVKHGGQAKPREAYSLDEVVSFGGTDRWSDSKENDQVDSRKPWFQPCITAILLVECPEGADDAFFPHVIGGKAYAAALFEAKSTIYDSFYIELKSKKKTTALFKMGWAGRVIELHTGRSGKKADASFKVLPTVKEATNDEIVALAAKIGAEASGE